MAKRFRFRRTAAALKALAKRQAPRDSGALVASLSGRSTRSNAIVDSGLRYAPYVELTEASEADLKLLDEAVMADLDEAEL